MNYNRLVTAAKKTMFLQSIPSSSPKTSAPPEFNLEKARAEIRQLGIQGFTGRTKTEAEIAKLRDLGAKVRLLNNSSAKFMIIPAVV